MKSRAVKQAAIKMPPVMGNLAVNFFKSRFKAGGWLDKSFKRWVTRSASAKRNGGRKLLTDTRAMERAIKVVNVTGSTVKIGNSMPYAKAHNEGVKKTVRVAAYTRNRYAKAQVRTPGKRARTVTTLTGSTNVRSHTRKMNLPKRQFMGSSAHLDKIITRKVTVEIMKALNL